MGMGRNFGRSAALIAATAVLAVYSGCGTSNDQGISFRILHYLAPDEMGAVAVDSPSIDTVSVALGCASVGAIGVLLENVMAQGMFAERLDVRYDIPGSSLPSQRRSDPIFVRLGSATFSEAGNQSPPLGIGTFTPVEPVIVEVLNQNRNQLPDMPFNMFVRTTAVGITDSGDTIRTNTATLRVIVLDDTFCSAPTGGSDDDPAREGEEGEES